MKKGFIKATEYAEFEPMWFSENWDIDKWEEEMNYKLNRYNERLKGYLLEEGNQDHPYIKKDMIASFIITKSITHTFEDYVGKYHARTFNYYTPLVFFRVDDQIRPERKRPSHYIIGGYKPSDRWDYITTEELFFNN
jgi:hypothetical protein